MKRNTKTSKEFLVRAIKELPDDFALNEVKYYMNQALTKIKKLEEKREKREIVSQEIKPISINPALIPQTLDALDKMIKEEKKNLDNILNNKNKKDIDDLQTLFG